MKKNPAIFAANASIISLHDVSGAPCFSITRPTLSQLSSFKIRHKTFLNYVLKIRRSPNLQALKLRKGRSGSMLSLRSSRPNIAQLNSLKISRSRLLNHGRFVDRRILNCKNCEIGDRDERHLSKMNANGKRK